MSNWGKGYVTDVEYSDGFYPNQGAAHLNVAATIGGVEPAVLDDRFTYCELGCGRGMTSLVLAATNPAAQFHAVDFNPAHVAHARAQARQAGLDNIEFHECSFDELTGARGAALPMFDVVTMHGVWTWIAPELQSAILNFLNSRLRAGGLLYVSYNVLPAWFQASPLQRLVKELAAAAPQRSDLAVFRAIEQVDRFVAAKIVPDRFLFAAKRFKNVGNMLPYLAHEYLNELLAAGLFRRRGAQARRGQVGLRRVRGAAQEFLQSGRERGAARADRGSRGAGAARNTEGFLHRQLVSPGRVRARRARPFARSAAISCCRRRP